MMPLVLSPEAAVPAQAGSLRGRARCAARRCRQRCAATAAAPFLDRVRGAWRLLPSAGPLDPPRPLVTACRARGLGCSLQPRAAFPAARACGGGRGTCAPCGRGLFPAQPPDAASLAPARRSHAVQPAWRLDSTTAQALPPSVRVSLLRRTPCIPSGTGHASQGCVTAPRLPFTNRPFAPRPSSAPKASFSAQQGCRPRAKYLRLPPRPPGAADGPAGRRRSSGVAAEQSARVDADAGLAHLAFRPEPPYGARTWHIPAQADAMFLPPLRGNDREISPRVS